MKSNIFIQPYGDLGIPIHSRELVSELVKINSDLSIIPISNGNIGSLDKSIREKIGKPDYNGTAFMFWYPDSFEEMIGLYKKTIGYYIFEYTKIPKRYIDILNKLDIVCTASLWGKIVLQNNGVKTRIEVIRGGVNTEKFNTSNRRKYGNHILDCRFTFGHIGKYEKRKNTDLLIEAFLKAFPNSEADLLLSVDNPHLKERAQDIIERKFGKHSNINFINHLVDIRSFYRMIHCGVFPTSAEGIGLPITESIACGIPTIASFNTGITEYGVGTTIPLTDLTSIPVYDELFFPKAGEFGEWESPGLDELVDKMIYVRENYEECSNKGIYASRWMGTNFTWKQSAENLNNLLIGE